MLITRELLNNVCQVYYVLLKVNLKLNYQVIS